MKNLVQVLIILIKNHSFEMEKFVVDVCGCGPFKNIQKLIQRSSKFCAGQICQWFVSKTWLSEVEPSFLEQKEEDELRRL